MKLRNAEILCVGTEILIGDIVNTNAAYISKRLAALGINQYYQAVVGDNPERLKSCILSALERCDLLIMTGGLGPTYDDLTKETAAACMGRKLYLHERSLERMKRFFQKRSVTMTENNIKQAMMPEGSTVFDNDNGTAPGLAIEDFERGKIIVMLPGPPKELIPMFSDAVEPYLRQFSEYILYSKNINIVGIGESAVENVLSPLMRSSENPTVAPYCKDGEVRLRVTARVTDENDGIILCDKMIETIRTTEIGKYIYGIDTDLPTALVILLSAKGKKIATAESCTGGLVAEYITSVPGSSAVFDGSIVSYANAIKSKLLNVSEYTLQTHGAVSEETAREMAFGICNVMNADIGIAVTGIAGPGGGTEEKPVGLVYIAVMANGSITTRRCEFAGTRDRIRHLSAVTALSMAIQALK